MPGIWSRSVLLVVALGFVAACEEILPPEPAAPVAAPVVAPVVKKPVPTAPVVKKKKPVIIDFGHDGGGGGGWN